MNLIEFEQLLLNMQKYFMCIPTLRNKILCLKKAIKAFKKCDIPKDLFPSLELNENYIFKYLDKYPDIINFSFYLENFRQVMISEFGIWHLFNARWLEDLQKFCGWDSKNLEIMSGNAMISKFLHNTIPTDTLNWSNQDNKIPTPWVSVEKIDALQAVKKYYQRVDNIILSWAPDNSNVDFKILKFLRKNKYSGNFIVIGEKYGSTNSKFFWNTAKLIYNPFLNRNHKPFDFINDKVWIVK